MGKHHEEDSVVGGNGETPTGTGQGEEEMSTPVLRFLALPRGRISDRLAASPDDLSPLTLLRAPAGFGKTTAAIHWTDGLRGSGVDARWVRPLERDADPRLIWQRIHEALGGDARRRDQAQLRDDIDRILSSLDRSTVLLLDDYQHVTSGDLDLALSRLLERSSRLHLVVLGRRFTSLDGPLVSSRIGVTLLSGDELAFSEEESLELASLYGISQQDHVARLHRRSHGWPVIMRSTLQQMSEGIAPRDSARTLAVFGRQHLEGIEMPGAKLALLTAVLCPDISIEVLAEVLDCEVDRAERIVRELCEQGLLQESLWEYTSRYRCHGGLAGPLRTLALQELGDEVRDIRLRHAADLGRDDPAAAAIQLLDAEEYGGVSRLMARYFLEIVRPDGGVVQRLLRIPDDVLREQPVLTGAVVFLMGPGVEVPEQRMAQLFRWLRAGIRSELREGNYEQNIAAIGLLIAAERMRGDGAEALRISRDAEERIAQVPETRMAGYRFTFPLLFSALGAAGLVGGDLELGRRNYQQAVDVAARFENRIEEVRAWNGLTLVTALSGDLRAAEEHLRRAEEQRAALGVDAPQFSGFNAVMSAALIAIERGDAEEALGALDPGLAVLNRLEHWPLMIVSEAQALELLEGPRAAIEAIERRRASAQGGMPSTFTLRCSLAAFAARLSVRLGDYAEAERMLETLPLPHPDVALASATLLLYRGDAEGALRRVGSLSAVTQRQRVEALLIEAAAHWARGETETSIDCFAEAGGIMRRLGLRLLLGTVPYDRLVQLAAAARGAGAIDLVDEVARLPETLRTETFEPLTKAELRTLGALATGLTVSGIAEQCFITENTVKFHLRGIYRKLRVTSRTAAVERATAMRLVPLESD